MGLYHLSEQQYFWSLLMNADDTSGDTMLLVVDNREMNSMISGLFFQTPVSIDSFSLRELFSIFFTYDVISYHKWTTLNSVLLFFLWFRIWQFSSQNFSLSKESMEKQDRNAVLTKVFLNGLKFYKWQNRMSSWYFGSVDDIRYSKIISSW